MIRAIINNVSAFDSAICLQVSKLNGKRLFDILMAWVSHLGDGYFYVIAALVMLLVDFQAAKHVIAAGAVAFSIELVLHGVLKKKTKRNRPFERVQGIKSLINPPDKFSFPSGHTGAAFVMAHLLAFFYPLISIPLYIFAALVGFSRIYNGLHYPSDVLAGTLLGICCAQIGIVIIM